MNLYTSILKNLFFTGPTSISELSECVGKSIPITTKGIKDLVKKNFITNIGLNESTGGRKAYIYKLNKDKMGFILSIAMERKQTVLNVFNTDKEKICDSVYINTTLKEDIKLSSEIILNVEKLLAEHNKDNFLAIGIVTPGFVDVHHKINTSYQSTSPLYNISQTIQRKFGISTFIENDSSAIAIVEKYFGKAQSSSDTLVFNLTWGVGLGILVDSKLFRGHRGYAGEFSHIPLGDETKLCQCGKKGCLEVEASLQSAIDFIQESISNGEISILKNTDEEITFEQLLDAYKHGDQLTIKAIQNIAHMLGKGIATLIHILNPETIIIAGKGIPFSDILKSEINSSIQLYCIPRLAEQTKIEISELEDILPLAATSIALEQIDRIQTS